MPRTKQVVSDSTEAVETPPVPSVVAQSPVAQSDEVVQTAPQGNDKSDSGDMPTMSAASATPSTTNPNTAPEPVKSVPVEPLRPRMTRPSNPVANGFRPQAGNRPMAPRPSMMRPAPVARGEAHHSSAPTEPISGLLDLSRDGHGVVRNTYSGTERDAYLSTAIIRRYRLRAGDEIVGQARAPKENDRYWAMAGIETVNGYSLEELQTLDRVKFQSLTPVYPDTQIKLETGEEPLSLRVIDLIAPIGRGQRSLIVSPPKAGKTTLLKEIATGIAQNYQDIHLMAVLVGERPEEVTDIRRHIEKLTAGKGETAASNFDEAPEDQCRVAELALERAKRLVETGKDVVILLDSITRLARAYNLSIPTSGRTLSGGFDPAAIHPTKRFFGAARNFEVNGSLTIIGTALVDTGSRMDDVVFEEFKGTGNQEVILDRYLAERRIYPAIDAQRSGTRRDDLLIDPMTYQALMTLQRMLDTLDKDERTTTLLGQLKRTKSNKEFLVSLKAG